MTTKAEWMQSLIEFGFSAKDGDRAIVGDDDASSDDMFLVVEKQKREAVIVATFLHLEDAEKFAPCAERLLQPIEE